MYSIREKDRMNAAKEGTKNGEDAIDRKDGGTNKKTLYRPDGPESADPDRGGRVHMGIG